MKKISKKFIFLLLLATHFVHSQDINVKYDRTVTDTSDVGVHETIMLKVKNFPNNTNRCELLNAFAIDENNQKIKPEYFLTEANKEFWITFEKNKKSKKLNSINGKVRFFNTSKEEETIIEVDNILEKVNKTIYSKNDIKIVVLDIESLKSKKETKPLEYKNEIARIVKENKLNQKWFEKALEKTFENYYHLYNMIIYCEDPKNEIENIDELFKTYSKWTEGITNQSIKTFLFSRSDSTNMVRISIKNSKTFKEIDFKELIIDEN